MPHAAPTGAVSHGTDAVETRDYAESTRKIIVNFESDGSARAEDDRLDQDLPKRPLGKSPFNEIHLMVVSSCIRVPNPQLSASYLTFRRRAENKKCFESSIVPQRRAKAGICGTPSLAATRNK